MEVVPGQEFDLPLDVGDAEVSAVAFHPDKPVAYVAAGEHLFAYELYSGALSGRGRVNPGSRIHALVSSPDYLVAATEDGCLYVYEGDFLVAGTVGPLCPAALFAGLKGERVPFAALALSPLMPWLFFARADSKEIYVIDLATKQKLSFKMDAKKPVTALACDPGQPQLAAASSDGVVRVWDYTRQRIHFQTDDFNSISLAKKIPLSRISALEFFQQQIVAVGQNGVVVLWNLSLKEASKVSAGCRIMRNMLPVVGAAAHHALPCLLTLSANGTLFSWKLTTHPDKKISIHPGGYTQDFNAVVTETERRVDYVSSFGDRSDAPQLEATGLVAHQSLNYLAFTFNRSPKPDGVPPSQVGTRVCFYSLMPRSNPAMLLPQAERVEVQSDFFHEERFTFDFPVDRFHFVDRNKVQSHSLLDGNNMLEDELPMVPEDVGTTLHPTRFLYSPILRQFLVFGELYDTIALNKDDDSSFDSISNVREQKKSLLSLKLKEGKSSSSGSIAGGEGGPEDSDSKDDTNKKERHHHAKEKKKLMAKFQVRTYAHLPAASVSQRTKYRYWLSADHNSSEGKNAPRVLQKGRDGVFIGSHHLEYVVISESGEKLHVASTNPPTSSKASHKLKLDLPRPMLRVFKTPLASERAVLYFDPTDSKVVYSLNVATGSTEITAFLPSPERRHSLKLYRGEVPIDVLWKPQAASSHTHLAAVITTHFIRLFSSDLRGNIREIFKYEKPYKAGPAYFQSGYWLGSSLLFSTPTGISYLTIEGIVRPLCSLDVAGAVITAVMNDRIFYACPYHDRTQIRSQPVGLLEPLLMGQLSMAPFLRLSPHHLRPLIARIVGRFDCRRVSQFLLEELDRRGLPDLAFALAENSILLDDIYKYELAVRSLSFHKAINLLYKAYKNSPEYPALPESSELRGRFVHLAEVAVDFQQYEIARRCYEVLNDYYALLHIYAICRDVDGLKSLTVSDIQDAPVGLAELAQMLIVVEAQNAEKPAGVSNAAFTSLYTTSHWNALQATHPIMRVGQGPECEMVTVAPLKPEGVQDWLGKKLDWNPAFIPSSQRPAPPPPLTLASDHSLDGDHRSGAAAGGRRASVVNVPDKGGYLMLVPPSRKLHIPKVALPYCDSTTPTLRRTLSDENVRRMTHYATKSAGDASGTTSDGDTLDQDDVDSTEFSGTSEIPSSTNVDDTFSPMTDNTEDDEEDTETETVRDVDMDDEDPRERAEKEGSKPGEGEKQENETPAESNEETLATISSERNKITNAREGMRRMLLLMDLGRFNSAFDHADLSIRLLRKDAEERRREIKFCASYKLALSLLLKIKQLQRLAREGTPSSSSSLSSVVASTAKLLRDKNPASGLALISRHLTEVRLDPRHSALLLSLVIGIQMDLGNFNYAAGLVRRLLAAQLEAAAAATDDASADRAALIEKLRECEERGGRGAGGGDAVPIPYKCVRCGHLHAGKVPGSHCDKCRAPIRFCHSSYELIGRSHFYACRLCEATYAHDTPKCSLCLSAASPLSPRRVTTPAQ